MKIVIVDEKTGIELRCECKKVGPTEAINVQVETLLYQGRVVELDETQLLNVETAIALFTLYNNCTLLQGLETLKNYCEGIAPAVIQ